MEEDKKMKKIEFSEEVKSAIDEVLPRTDCLDSPDFNAVEYINQLFPNEQSLANIDDVIAKMQCEVSMIDDNIRTVVRGQTNTGQDGRMALEEAQKVINQLFSQIIDIKTRAEKTETMVKEITADIKQLDCAKKNLTVAITTLNHLHMLVSGVEHLNVLIEKRHYGEILNPLQAVIEVNTHFLQYNNIPQIEELSVSVETIQRQLAIQINEDFHRAFSTSSGGDKNKNSFAVLADACKVVSVLDKKVKRDLLKWFIDIQLEEYLQLFHENQDIASLDKIDKRYAWLKRHLLDFESKFGAIFPLDWEVSERISIHFCVLTRDELTKILKKARNEIDGKLLLYVINKTQHFEQLLAKRFSGVTFGEEKGAGSGSGEFIDLISVCFKPYLDIYTTSIERNLAELIESFEKQAKEPFNPITAGTTVFPSSGDLFVFYKKCMVQCTQLSNGKPLYDLGMIFKKYLREYAKVLQLSMPKLTTQQTSIGTSMSLLTKDLQNLSTAAGQVFHNLLKEGESQRFSTNDIVQICCVLTTAEYCFETVHQLEEKLKQKLDPSYVDRIDLSDETDIFHRAISNCIQLLVQDMENGCDPALNVMIKMQWQNVSNVGDQSDFVNLIKAHFIKTIPIIRDNLSTSRKYFTQFCHKFVNAFMPKFVTAFYKCRLFNSDGSINVVGCEQLLLDTHSLKTILLDLPSIGSTVNRKAPTSFTKVVVKGMTRAEMIIKVVMTPTVPMAAFNAQVLKLLPDIAFGEYQKLLDMKGVKRVDQLQLVEMLKRTSTVAPDADGAPEASATDSAPSSSKKGFSFGVGSNGEPAPASDRSRIKRLENLLKNRLP